MCEHVGPIECHTNVTERFLYHKYSTKQWLWAHVYYHLKRSIINESMITNPKYGPILKKITITQNSIIKAWTVPKLCPTLKLQLPTRHMRCPTKKNRMLIKYSDKDDIKLNTLMKYRYTVQEDLQMRKTKLIHSTEKDKHHRAID